MSEGKSSEYELALVINGNASDEERENTLENVKTLFNRFEAEVIKVEDWGKRRLAYEMQKVREGYYYFITFRSPSSSPVEVEKRIRIMENVLRFLIVKVEE